jgi:hypothetical protein
MADKRKAILVRLPAELWQRLNRWAADELRSVNAQIEYVLREAARKRFGDEPESPDTGSADEPVDEPPRSSG